MRQARGRSAPAQPADEGELGALQRVYSRHVEAGGAPTSGLAAVVQAHLHRARQRPPGDSVVGTSTPTADGGTCFDVITEETPFVVESLLAGFSRTGARVRHVVHPVVTVRRDGSGALVEVVDSAQPLPGSSTELWIRAEVDPVPGDEAEEIAAELRAVLRDVRDVAVDQDALLDAARSAAAELRDTGPDETEVRDAAGLVEWLADGRFVLLGHSVDDDGHRAGPGLGVLRREEVLRRVFDGMTAEPDEDVVLLTRASTPCRVYRPVHQSVLVVRIGDRPGRRVREHRFLGAFTRAALYEDVLAVPRLGRRVRAAIARAGAHLESFTGQRMLEVIAEYPREDLFWAGEELLHDLALGVPALAQPRRLQLSIAREPFGR